MELPSHGCGFITSLIDIIRIRCGARITCQSAMADDSTNSKSFSPSASAPGASAKSFVRSYILICRTLCVHVWSIRFEGLLFNFAYARSVFSAHLKGMKYYIGIRLQLQHFSKNSVNSECTEISIQFYFAGSPYHFKVLLLIIQYNFRRDIYS